jgi:hypothetical protein
MPSGIRRLGVGPAFEQHLQISGCDLGARGHRRRAVVIDAPTDLRRPGAAGAFTRPASPLLTAHINGVVPSSLRFVDWFFLLAGPAPLDPAFAGTCPTAPFALAGACPAALFAGAGFGVAWSVPRSGPSSRAQLLIRLKPDPRVHGYTSVKTPLLSANFS